MKLISQNSRFGRLLTRFHRDEQGDEGVNKILIIALIAIPIVILLIAFGKEIVEWFQTNWGNLRDDKDGVPTDSGGSGS